jgi:PAS domain S-box-containing protein
VGGSPDDRQHAPVNVLVVDDHAENRTAVKAILSSPEYRVVEAATGRAALKLLLQEEFAVLLFDVVMPEMNGFELASAVKQRERASRVPIIFLTAEATDVNLVFKGYLFGAVDYIVKPLVPEMVRAKVAVFAELYRQRKHIEQQSRLLVQAERRESERRYRNLAEAVPHVVWTARPDGTVDYLNQRWFEYTGIPSGEIGGGWYVGVHAEDLARSREAWSEARRVGRAYEFEVRLRSSRGSYRWHLGRVVPDRDTAGEIISWLGTFTDIDDRKRTESILAEFKGTLDAVLDAILIFDSETRRCLYANHGSTVLLGYSREELLQMSPFHFMIEYDEARMGELLGPPHGRDHRATTLETKYRRKDTRVVPVELSIQRIPIDGDRIVSIVRDITDRKHAELERDLLYRQTLDAVRVRDEFLSVASHELKTPLSSLRLQIEMLQRKGTANSLSREQLADKLAVAIRQVDRLSYLVAQLMDVSRIASGRLRLELEDVDMTCVARDVVTRLADDAARAHCEVALTADEAVIGKWDKLRVEQVMTNLLSNALKFGAGHPIEVDVSGVDGIGRLTVRDHGIGVASKDIGRIFGRFERAVSVRAFGGLGLGLFIVRQVVEAQGGTVRADSQLGAGTTFTVELPMTPARFGDVDRELLLDRPE